MHADAPRRTLVELLPRLRRFCLSLTGTRHDADDLLQSTVERMLERGLPPDAAPDRWVFRVYRNLWVDEIRARRVRAASPLDDETSAARAIDGEREMIGRIELADVGRALDTLPEEQRSALSLVVLEGFTYAEAAEALGIPIGTITSRIARARGALATALRAPGHGGGVAATGVRA